MQDKMDHLANENRELKVKQNNYMYIYYHDSDV